jgi:hypothetical protein
MNIKIYKKTFWKQFIFSLKEKNKEIKITKTANYFCLNKTKKKWLCFKAFLPQKQVRMIFIVFHNCDDKSKCKINFIFLIGPIEGKDIRYKEISNISFSMKIMSEKELELQLKSFLLDEKIDSDYFINNKFKK